MVTRQIIPANYVAAYAETRGKVTELEKCMKAANLLGHQMVKIAVQGFKYPPEMETYLLKGGKYAVFIHQGLASEATKIMQYIFGQWLPQSKYVLDSREHFEILPEGYSPLDPQAREEIWIPIKEKL